MTHMNNTTLSPDSAEFRSLVGDLAGKVRGYLALTVGGPVCGRWSGSLTPARSSSASEKRSKDLVRRRKSLRVSLFRSH